MHIVCVLSSTPHIISKQQYCYYYSFRKITNNNDNNNDNNNLITIILFLCKFYVLLPLSISIMITTTCCSINYLQPVPLCQEGNMPMRKKTVFHKTLLFQFISCPHDNDGISGTQLTDWKAQQIAVTQRVVSNKYTSQYFMCHGTGWPL